MIRKNINIAIAFVLAVCFAACSDDSDPKFKSGTTGTSGQFTSPAQNTALVFEEEKAQEQVTLSWSATDFGIPVGVRYVLQMDKLSGDYSKAYNTISTINNGTSVSISVKDLNSAMMSLGLFVVQPWDVKFRLKSVAMGGEEGTANLDETLFPSVYSNDLNLSITPYPAPVPLKTPLYIVGAVFSGLEWNTALSEIGKSLQPFFSSNSELGNGEYHYTGYFYGGGEGHGFKLISAPPAWKPQYGDGGGGNIQECIDCAYEEEPAQIMVGEAGWYTLEVNMTTLKYTMTKIAEPTKAFPATVYLKGESTDYQEIALSPSMAKNADDDSDFNPYIFSATGVKLTVTVGGLHFYVDGVEYGRILDESDNQFPYGSLSQESEQVALSPMNEATYTVIYNALTNEYNFITEPE